MDTYVDIFELAVKVTIKVPFMDIVDRLLDSGIDRSTFNMNSSRPIGVADTSLVECSKVYLSNRIILRCYLAVFF